MAFEGILLQINGLDFPNRFIAVETYDITPNQMQDEDSYVDANGYLHRNILPHTRTKCEFTTPVLKESDIRALMAYFPNTVTMTVRYWNPKEGKYGIGTFYTPDITFSILKINGAEITYSPIRIALIEY